MRKLLFTLLLYSPFFSFSQKSVQLAYVHWNDTISSENRINTMNLDGTGIQTIVDYPGSNWMVMAMGTKVWFHLGKDTAGKKMGLYTYDTRSKQEKYLFDARGLYQDIDHNKRTNLYTGGFSHKPIGASRSQYDIFLFNDDGTVKQPVTNDTAIDLEPVFSPDGEQIIFRSNRDRNPKSWGEFEIYSIHADGSGLKRLTFNPDTTANVLRASNPAWVPGGRIAFTGYWYGTYRIMIMNKDGTELRTLIPMDEMEQTGFCFSPDSKQIVFNGKKKGARNSDIYLVNADGTNLRQLTNDWRRKVQPFFIISN